MRLKGTADLTTAGPASDLEQQLYLSLRAKPCSCEYERTAAGVPQWFQSKGGGGIERHLIKQCSRCAGVEAFERAYGAL